MERTCDRIGEENESLGEGRRGARGRVFPPPGPYLQFPKYTRCPLACLVCSLLFMCCPGMSGLCVHCVGAACLLRVNVCCSLMQAHTTTRPALPIPSPILYRADKFS